MLIFRLKHAIYAYVKIQSALYVYVKNIACCFCLCEKYSVIFMFK